MLDADSHHLRSLRTFFRRLFYIIRRHQHSIYVWCPNCHARGVNMPHNPVCCDCGYDKCIEYYPTGVPK
jgi:hypothetical protein